MANANVRLVGYNRVQNKLRRLAADHPEQIDSTIYRWAQGQRRKLKGHGYPPQSGRPQPFRTDKSRRYFFWALREGLISVPYRRTGRLANSYRVEKEGRARYTITNSAPYAPLVVGKGSQARYHAGNWYVMEDEVQADAPELAKLIAKDLIGLFNG